MKSRDPQPRGRRTFLQQMALVIGGAFGINSARAETPIKNPSIMRFKLRCRRKTTHRPEATPANSGRLLCQGDLLDPRNERAVGEFYANCFGTETAFGILNPSAGSNIEFHTIKLDGGTLFGIGSGAGRSGTSENAILGGTGEFAGARGTYQINEPRKTGPDRSEIVIHLLG